MRGALFVALIVAALLAAPARTAVGQDGEPPAVGEHVDPLLVPFRGQIDFCFERERSLRPGAHGRVSVRATIDATGRARDAVLAGTTFEEPDSVVASCLLAAVARWTFPTTAEVVGREHLLHFDLLARAPVRVTRSPVAIDVIWHLQYRRGVGLRYGDTVADELLAAMEHARAEIRGCIAAAPDALEADGGMEIGIRVPGGGDVGRDDVDRLGGTFGAAHPLTRCLFALVMRFEARSASEPEEYRWIITWTVDPGEVD